MTDVYILVEYSCNVKGTSFMLYHTSVFFTLSRKMWVITGNCFLSVNVGRNCRLAILLLISALHVMDEIVFSSVSLANMWCASDILCLVWLFNFYVNLRAFTFSPAVLKTHINTQYHKISQQCLEFLSHYVFMCLWADNLRNNCVIIISKFRLFRSGNNAIFTCRVKAWWYQTRIAVLLWTSWYLPFIRCGTTNSAVFSHILWDRTITRSIPLTIPGIRDAMYELQMISHTYGLSFVSIVETNDRLCYGYTKPWIDFLNDKARAATMGRPEIRTSP